MSAHLPFSPRPGIHRFTRCVRQFLLLLGVLGLSQGIAGASEAGGSGIHKMALPPSSAIQPTAYLRVSMDAATQRGGQQWFSASFHSLRGHAVSIRFAMAPNAGLSSMRGFGISESEIDALLDRCRRDRSCDQPHYQNRLHQYYQAHKLKLRTGPGIRPSLYVDVPRVVAEHRRDIRPVADALKHWARTENQSADALFDAAAALVQSSLAYRAPAAVDAGRKTLGFYPPPRAIEKGYGDCDTKSALLAAILTDLGSQRLIGVRVPNHYLLGIGRTPKPGETWIEHQGQPFVLLEAAGPARRPPGQVSDQTQLALAEGHEMRIDPMF